MHVVPIQLPCRFQCDGCLDGIEHYMQCRALWHLVALLRGQLHSDALVRLGLGAEHQHTGENSRLDSLARVAVSFRLYHHIKDYKDSDCTYPVHLAAVTAARAVLRPPASLSGGAGARGP